MGTSDTSQDLALERLLLQVLKRCWSSIFSHAVRRSLPGHLTPQQVYVLGRLSQQPAKPSELARDHQVGLSAMTGLVDGLVERKLVERQHSTQDRRAVQLKLTPAGGAVWAEAQASVLEAAHHLLTPLSATERQRLAAALADLERLVEPADACESGRQPTVVREG